MASTNVETFAAELKVPADVLLEQLRARYGASVDIQYLQREPGAIVIDFVRS